MAQEWTLHGTMLQPAPVAGTAAASHRSISSAPRPSTRGQAAAASSTGRDAVAEVDFQAMRKEVTAFGAGHLERKRDKQSFEERTLRSLGFTAKKGPRMGAKMGLGVARKAHEREQQEEEELAAANMVQVKGRGKRREAQRKGPAARGLNEARGFTPGLMRVRKPAGARSGRGDGAPAGKRANAGPVKGRGGRRL